MRMLTDKAGQQERRENRAAKGFAPLPKPRWVPAQVEYEPTYKFITVGERNPERKAVISGQQAVNRVKREKRAAR